ncbi:MAG: ATP12 family protein [Mesorhizobium sp.]|jgi:chaperone required for assembly of F1-ATPase
MPDIPTDLEGQRQLSDPDPVRRAQLQMKAALPKRFYREAAVAPAVEGFGVTLDGKAVRTPAGAELLLPTAEAAALVADEYGAQVGTIDPTTMPVTRLANTAIDGVAEHAQAVIEDIMRFSASDLLCYRAAGPERLVERQNEAWDPVLDWARQCFGARFALAEGVMHVEQPREAVGAVGIHLTQRSDPLRLAAIHLMTSLTGSALLSLAVEAGALDADAAFEAAHIDEDWNIEHWGEDVEAARRRALRKADMMAAARLLAALGGPQRR